MLFALFKIQIIKSPKDISNIFCYVSLYKKIEINYQYILLINHQFETLLIILFVLIKLLNLE